jgi:S-adenosylmethionine synthetase
LPRTLFTSESVTEGHPDKIADQVSDGVLDAALTQDPRSRVACEALLTTGLIVVAGEITTRAQIDYQQVARDAVRGVGYTDARFGFDCDTCGVLVSVHQQSGDIAMGVDREGAGDQGMMFGYACDQTPEKMPLPVALAKRLTRRLSELRREGQLSFLRPDGKSQVTIEYEDGRPKRVDAVVVSTQHSDEISTEALREAIRREVIEPVMPKGMTDGKTAYHINPTGRFVIGGPMGDTGVTGRKIIVDTYGGMGRHGGGAFSGKDPSKVDRSAALMARYIARNVVTAGLASTCEVQLAYAIGVADPVSVRVETFGTHATTEGKIAEAVRRVFPLTPKGIIETLKLRRPIYQKTAAFGPFGQDDPDFTWEREDKAEALREAAGLTSAALAGAR